MFNKKLYDSIFNCTIKLEELKKFCKDVETAAFDYDDSFNKYYNLEIILAATKKFKTGQISAEYLSYWATAYMWILNATPRKVAARVDDEEVWFYNFAEFIEDEILDCLDSLSFFNNFCENGTGDVKGYERTFKYYNKIFSTLDDWKVFYRIGKDAFAQKFICFLAVNKKQQKFAKLFCENANYKSISKKEKPLKAKEMEQKIKELKAEGFLKLR